MEQDWGAVLREIHLFLGPVDTVTCAGEQGGGMGRIFLDINRPHVCLLEVEEAWLLKGHCSSLCNWIDLSFYPCSDCRSKFVDLIPIKYTPFLIFSQHLSRQLPPKEIREHKGVKVLLLLRPFFFFEGLLNNLKIEAYQYASLCANLLCKSSDSAHELIKK